MKILASLNDFLTKNRKNILYIFWFFFIFFMFFDASLANATTATTPQTQANDKSIFIQWINGFLKIVAALLWLLTFLVGLFLYPEWTSGSIVWLWWSDGALKTMWIMMSNVVYFIFALIFIWIAFMNIIGKDGETYGLKTAMPRFIIWVLIVPFTWFFVQFILSISSILTVWVLSLPYDTFKDTYMKIDKLEQVKFCKDYVINTWTLTGSTFPISCKEWSKDAMSLSDIVNPKNSDSLFWITTVYTYWVMALDENGKLYSQNIINGINDIIDLWLKAIFDLVFLIVYALLMIALALALFVRGVYLWFYAMLSPVFWLLYFFKKEKEGIADGKFSLKEFISLAFVPVYVSAALAFWLLFLFAAWNAITTKSDILDEKGKTIKFAWFTYTIEWPAASWWDVKKWINKLIEGFQGTFGTLLLQIFWLAILWMAVMAALKQSKITENVVSPFEDFWKSIGSLAMKAPTYMPIIPTGSGMMSAQGLSTAGQSFSSAIHNEYTWQWSKFWSQMAKNMWFWNQALSDIKDILNKQYTNEPDKRNWMNDLLSKIDASQLWDSWYRSELAKAFKHLWATADLETAIKVEGTSKEQLARILDQKWEERWWEKWQQWAGWLFVWKSAEQIASMIWRWWSAEPNPTPSQQLPSSITRDVNTPWKYQVWNTNITINNNDWGKNLSSTEVNALATALQQTKTTDWENKVKQVLNSMWITDVAKQKDILDKISSTSPQPPTPTPPNP